MTTTALSPDPTHTTPANLHRAIYIKNMQQLWRNDPRLAMAIDAVPPSRAVPLEPARDGSFTAKMPAATGQVYLHSRYRPEHEAATWAAALECEDKYAVIVNGFGLGYHVKALFARLPEDALLIVAEPSLPLLKSALSTLDLSELLCSNRVLLFTTLDRSAIVERLEPRSVLFTAGTGALFVTHPASLQIEPEFHNAFQTLITEFVAFTRIGFVTLMLNNVTTCANIANNLGRYASTPPVDLLHNAYAGLPAILVAAGPSLAKNMHLLHEVKGDKNGKGRRAVIIAVQTMLKPLLAAGIEPDFVTSLDYNTVSTRFFENLEDSGMKPGAETRVHLVAEAKANWNVLDVFPSTMSVIHNEFAERLLRGTFPTRMGMKAGATVAHLSFYLAEFLGCNPIILIGQDLGFVDGLYYKPGTAIHETWGVELNRFNTLETKEWERIVRSRTILRKIPDIHGHPMYTEEQFFVYLQQFERDFAASRHTVIDATEGGARKQHVTPMTLRNAIDQFCNKEVPHNIPSWKTWHCDRATHLQQTIFALTLRQKSANEMLTTCDQTLPLLHQMIEHQNDDQKMNQLFVEVDSLRTRVGNDPQTFEMVCTMNTIGELRRFQADMTVKKSAKDSKERQKQQLLRDIDYVENLKTGATRLLEVLTTALARLQRQLDATQHAKPWPREVAGASK